MAFFDHFRTMFGRPETVEPDVKKDAALPLGQDERRTRERQNPKEGTRILVIDDSPTIVMAMKRILRSVGCITLEATDGEKGIELARQECPDLIFLDIVLPGMNGFAALRHLRRDPLTHNIPIIMISGNEQAIEQFFGTRIGADDFIKKPFSRFEVFSKIEKLLDENQVPRRLVANESRTNPLSPNPGE